MAPTIQSSHVNELDKRAGRNGEKKSDLVCRIKYCNTLPDIPFDPKFITYPFESNRFVQYNPTSLERNHKHEFLTEHDIGVPIDLINADTYALNDNAALGTLDEKLLEEEVATPHDTKRSRHHAKSVSWLRRTEYISTEYTRFQPSSDKTETKVGYNVKRFFKEEDLYMDRESQIKAIDNTFEDTKKPIEKHHTKPNVTPVETFSLFPDFEMWRYPCAQVIFDSDPASIGRPLPAQLEEMSQAMIRGVMDESGEQFVAYFLPTDDTLRKRKRDAEEGVEYKDDEEYEYTMAREYNWNVKNKASKGYEENYYFVFRNEGVYYNELETRVRLNKRRLKPGTQPNNSRLVVHHRPLNELEFKTQEVRMMQLEPQQEDEEVQQPLDEEDEEADEGQETTMETEREKEDEQSETSKNDDDEDDRKMDESDSENNSDDEKKSSISGEEEEEEEEEKRKVDHDEDRPVDQSGSEDDDAAKIEEEKDKSDGSEDENEKRKERAGNGAESDAYEDDEEEGAAKPKSIADGDEDPAERLKEGSASPAASSSGSSSGSSSSSSSSGSSNSSPAVGKSSNSSDSEGEEEEEEEANDEQKKKRDEAEIFGSASDSD